MYRVVYFTPYGNIVQKQFNDEATARAFLGQLSFGWLVRYTTSTTITDITTPEPEPNPDPEET